MKKLNFVPTCVLIACAVFASCQAQDTRPASRPSGDKHESMWKSMTKAVCVIHPTEGNTAKGVVWFTQDGDSIKVVADVEGLKPNAKHAIHIHQWGDTTGGDGKTTGGHYNPEGHDHAGPSKAMRHAGDLGNLQANAAGKAHYELVVKNVTIAGMKNPIVGRGVIVHKGEDDLKSQPTGAAGPRIGQGVIGIAKP